MVLVEPRADDLDSVAEDGPQALALRLGGGDAVVCAACGCRLCASGPDTWRHYPGPARRDARGCFVYCIGFPHAVPRSEDY
jgi:hypothetical protein